ncbi:sarcosine oxidase subunit gamma [Pseudonocardia cypriaca]|uniref:Sarcosine oxidase subunit gamma n=1 Tax=Pseudonocardia cypriaca TaxID=882449 RepID=A0A543GCN6_9PSEU|nr:sarcosine oxidase subunit gamma family protein [Pseudonocardia cypriaca]TQM43818.1 sarcosine oxidase subunit gamma [Pseudonocardia cypriaca]
MTVELPRTGPLHGWSEHFADLPDGVQIMAEPFVAMADLRVDPTGPAADAVAAHLRAALPTRPSWVDGERTRVIWLGPDEWLVTSPFRNPEELEADLRAAVGAEGAVVDVSAQRTTLRLRGEHVRDVLATGCAIDLHPRAFPAGSAVQTTLGLAGVVLLALDDTATHYQLLVRSSFARYLATWLLDAATEFRGA